MRIFRFTTSLLLGVASATTAFAATPQAVLQTDEIRTEQVQIKAGLDSRKGAYKDLPSAASARLLSGQARVLELIEGKQSTDELDDAARAELFAALASIDAIVDDANDARQVCQQVKTLGSNRKERVCRTAGQMRAQREAARDQLGSGGLQGAGGD